MFKTELVLADIGEPDLWAIAEPLVYVTRGLTITVPQGFITDLASIPMAIRNIPLLDVNGLSRRPAALHDWLYAGEREHGKDFADTTLREALLIEGLSKFGANIYFYGVHWFGKSSWAQDGMRHPFSQSPGHLMSNDFMTQEEYNAWQASKASGQS